MTEPLDKLKLTLNKLYPQNYISILDRIEQAFPPKINDRKSEKHDPMGTNWGKSQILRKPRGRCMVTKHVEARR